MAVSTARWCLPGLVVSLCLCPAVALAALLDQPVSERPGPVRPGAMPDHSVIAAAQAPAVAQTARPGAVRPGLDDDAFAVNPESLAAGPGAAAAAARPGAIRPLDNTRLTPEAPPGKLFDVPPVVDRPLEVDDGDKVVVSRFVVEGAQDRPEHGIEVSAVQAIVDGRIGAHADGFTVGRLQEVADEVTKYYREHGLILAQVFVPVQTVEDGVVRIQVLEGLLGQVLTEGNEMYSAAVLTVPFRSLIGEPVTKESIETALLTVSDLPGQSSFGVFQPGVQVGTADMVVKVQEEDRVAFNVRADNHGISETGQNRYLGQLEINNPVGQGDQFVATVQQTEVPDNTFFYAFDYDIPVTVLYGSKFALGISRNQFDVGGEFRDSDISSDIRTYYGMLSRDFIRSRTVNLEAGLRMSKKRSGTKAAGRRVNLDSLAVLALEVNFDAVDARFAGLNAGYLEISHGFNDLFGAMGEDTATIPPTRQGGTGEIAVGSFDKVLLNLSRFQSMSILWDKLENHSLLFAFEVMWSPDLLVPLEQYNIGGPISVRGYRPTEGLFDRAVFGSVEWIINAPFIADQPAFGNRTWGELMQWSVFYDVGSGKLNSALPSERESENFNSVGFALSFNNPNVFSTKITIATPLGKPDPENGKDPQYWVDLNFFF